MNQDDVVNVDEIKGYKIIVSCPRIVLARLVNLLTITEEEIKRFKLNGKLETHKKDVIETLAEVDYLECTLVCSRGFSFYVLKELIKIKSEYKLVINFKVDLTGKLSIHNKWNYILRDKQLEYAKTLLKFKGTLTQLPTGFGKTEIFVAILDSFLYEYPQFHVMILVPGNKVRDEVNLRLKKYNLHQDDRIRVVNPVGYLRSKISSLDSEKTWYEKVKMCITDEVHHITANSYNVMYSRCPDLEYSYGFSGTVSNSKLLDYENFDHYNNIAKRLIGMTGPSLVQKTGKDEGKTIKYLEVLGAFGNVSPTKLVSSSAIPFATRVASTCENVHFVNLIVRLVRAYGYNKDDRVFYIPIPNVNPGKQVYGALDADQIPTIHLHSGKFYHNVFDEPEIKDLEQLKEAMSTGKFKVLIATSSANEGIDVPILSAVIMAFGRDEKFPIQSGGRAGRDGEPALIINVVNMEDPVLKAQAKCRYQNLKKHYDFKKFEWKFNVK